MKCKKCGFENEQTDLYCAKCGEKLNSEDDQQQEPSHEDIKTCPDETCSCHGKSFQPEDKFCPECGKELIVLNGHNNGYPNDNGQKSGDVIEEDRVTYHRISIVAPQDFERGVNNLPSDWHHLNNHCLGQLYIGNNAMIMCAKCGEKHHALEYDFRTDDGTSEKGLIWTGHRDESRLSNVLSIAGQLVPKTGIQWQQQLLSNL